MQYCTRICAKVQLLPARKQAQPRLRAEPVFLLLQKCSFPLAENVGANIVRPPTLRSSAFSGKFFTPQTATGEHCSPLQILF